MHTASIAAALLLAFTPALVACRSPSNTTPATDAAPAASASTSSSAATDAAADGATSENGPLPRLVANDGAIALGNLDAQIVALDKQPDERALLIDALLSRGQLNGSIKDYERAAQLAAEWVAKYPKNPATLLARASTNATFHRFDAALADLAAAEKLKAKPDKLTAARASILEAQGKLDEAAALAPADEASTDITQLTGAAVRAGAMNRLPDAERLFERARKSYPNVSPFPLAWVDVQQAALYERNGKRESARRHYERALLLLPTYARAASHLAPLLGPDAAIALLEPITKTSDDPEVLFQLSEAQKRAGKKEEAAKTLDAAAARYDELLLKYPAAFADHAALMLLTTGRTPPRALMLAKVNFAARKTPEACDLLLSTALLAHDDAEACRASRAALALRYPTPDLTKIATPVAAKCPPAP